MDTIIEFDVDEEDGNVSDEIILSEIKNGCDQRNATIAEFNGLKRISPEDLPDGVGPELDKSLRDFKKRQLNNRMLPTMEEEAAIQSLKMAVMEGEDVIINAMGDIIAGNNFWEKDK